MDEHKRAFMLGAATNAALQISETYKAAIGSSTSVYWSSDMCKAIDEFKRATAMWHAGVMKELETAKQEPSPCVSIFSCSWPCAAAHPSTFTFPARPYCTQSK